MKQTVLNTVHRDLGARMVEFGGWDMPVQYTNLIEEHHAVRRRVGLFDVSHMGEFEISGKNAEKLIDKVVSNTVTDMDAGRMKLAVMCNEVGGIIDDLTVYKFGPERFWLVVNAGTKDKDLQWILDVKEKFQMSDVTVKDLTDEITKLDLQGPLAGETLKALLEQKDAEAVLSLRFYRFTEVVLRGIPVVVSQSGYTGEYGFELYCNNADGIRLWTTVMDAGKRWGLLPCGLGARDTLRTESAMMLYGHELDESVSPLDCVYSFVVAFNKDFIGRQGLFQQKDRGFTKKLVGFEMLDRGIARDKYRVFKDGREIGWVTSGTPSPTLSKNIGMAYVKPETAEIGDEIDIQIRDNLARAKIVKMPFYKRA